MIPLIWESFSTCCCRSRLSLSSRRFWYCRRILLVCCSCTRSRRSYSSSFLWDIRSRSFRALISSSYSRTWGAEISDADHRYACAHLSGQWRISILLQIVSLQIRNLLHRGECGLALLWFLIDVRMAVTPTLSMRDSSILLEYSFSLNSSRSIRELSMSADRWGMLETQATVRSLTGVGGFNVDGVWEPWGEKHNTQNDHDQIPISLIASDSLQILCEWFYANSCVVERSHWL